MPEEVKEPVKNQFLAFANTDIGKKGLNALSEGIEEWEEFSQKNPRAAQNIESGFNIMTFGVVGGTKVASQIAKRGIEATGAVAKEAGKRLVRAPVIKSQDLAELARSSYQRAEQVGGTLKPRVANQFIDRLDKFTPQTELGKRVTGETQFTQAIERIRTIRDQPISLQSAQEIDESLGSMIEGFIKEGRLTKEGKRLSDIQDTFRDTIEKASVGDIVGGKEGFNSLKEARKLWAGSRRLDDIERIIERAELTEQPATGIRSGFRTLITNKKRFNKFNKKEKKLIRKAAQIGIVPNALRTLGSRLVPILSAGGTVAGTIDPITTGAVFGAGLAARSAAGALQTRAAGKIAKEIVRTTLGK